MDDDDDGGEVEVEDEGLHFLSSDCSFMSSIPALSNSFFNKHWYARPSLLLLSLVSLFFLLTFILRGSCRQFTRNEYMNVDTKGKSTRSYLDHIKSNVPIRPFSDRGEAIRVPLDFDGRFGHITEYK